EVGVVPERGEMGDEVVGDGVQRHLGDVELVLADELQQEVERTLEVVQPHLEARARGRLLADGDRRVAVDDRHSPPPRCARRGRSPATFTGRGPRGPAAGTTPPRSTWAPTT